MGVMCCISMENAQHNTAIEYWLTNSIQVFVSSSSVDWTTFMPLWLQRMPKRKSGCIAVIRLQKWNISWHFLNDGPCGLKTSFRDISALNKANSLPATAIPILFAGALTLISNQNCVTYLMLTTLGKDIKLTNALFTASHISSIHQIIASVEQLVNIKAQFSLQLNVTISNKSKCTVEMESLTEILTRNKKKKRWQQTQPAGNVTQKVESKYGRWNEVSESWCLSMFLSYTYLFFPEQVKLLRVVSTLAKTYLIKVINIFHWLLDWLVHFKKYKEKQQ